MPPKSVEPPWYGPVCSEVVWEGWSQGEFIVCPSSKVS